MSDRYRPDMDTRTKRLWQAVVIGERIDGVTTIDALRRAL